MPDARGDLFDVRTWLPALEKFGAVTHLTVKVYADDRVVCGPFHATPLNELFARHGYDPGIFLECARQCVSRSRDRSAVVLSLQDGLAVVGTSLVLDGEIVGAAVAGYALVDFVGSSAIEHLAREAGVRSARSGTSPERSSRSPNCGSRSKVSCSRCLVMRSSERIRGRAAPRRQLPRS